MIFQQAPGWWIIRPKGWAEYSSPSFSLDGRGKRRFLHRCALVVLCTFFHLGANVKRSALGQSDDGFPLLAASLVSKEHSGWERGRGRGGASGDSGPMSNEKLPNGASTALHQGRWSWRGGCSRQMLKTASQATHLCSWVPCMAWSAETLQQAEACESGTKRELWKEKRKRASQGQTQTEGSVGVVRPLTADTAAKTFSPPQRRPRWARTKSSPPMAKASKECRAILPLQSLPLSLCSCITHAVCLHLFSFRYN